MTEPGDELSVELETFFDEANEQRAFDEQQERYKLEILSWFDNYYESHPEEECIDFDDRLNQGVLFVATNKLSLLRKFEAEGVPDGFDMNGSKKQAQADMYELDDNPVWFVLSTELFPGEGFETPAGIEMMRYLMRIGAWNQAFDVEECVYQAQVHSSLLTFLGYNSNRVLMPDEEMPLNYVAMRLQSTRHDRNTEEGVESFVRETEEDLRLIYLEVGIPAPSWLHHYLCAVSGLIA